MNNSEQLKKQAMDSFQYASSQTKSFVTKKQQQYNGFSDTQKADVKFLLIAFAIFTGATFLFYVNSPMAGITTALFLAYYIVSMYIGYTYSKTSKTLQRTAKWFGVFIGFIAVIIPMSDEFVVYMSMLFGKFIIIALTGVFIAPFVIGRKLINIIKV